MIGSKVIFSQAFCAHKSHRQRVSDRQRYSRAGRGSKIEWTRFVIDRSIYYSVSTPCDG